MTKYCLKGIIKAQYQGNTRVDEIQHIPRVKALNKHN